MTDTALAQEYRTRDWAPVTGASEGWPRETESIMVNVVSATILPKRAVAHMAANGGGRILNVASLAGFLPGPHMAVYHASKADLLPLS